MAKKKKAKAKASAKRATSRRSPAREDAISLLKADHREVEQLFEQFEKTRNADRKSAIAAKICLSLTVHTQIEEEVFYPAFIEATEEEDIHHEAVVEHDGAKKLIAEIEASGPDDEYYDAKVTVLSEMIKHHVKEEEQRGGMFAKAREAEMDLASLGEKMSARKQELMAQSGGGSPGRGRGRQREQRSSDL